MHLLAPLASTLLPGSAPRCDPLAQGSGTPDPDRLDDILADGARRARAQAAARLAEVYERVGFLPEGR